MPTALPSPRPVVAVVPNTKIVQVPAPRHHPLVTVLAAAAAGMVIDRYAPLAVPAWIVLAAALLATWFVLRVYGKDLVAAVGLLIAVAALAAAWHHDCWNLFGADDVGLFVRPQQEPVCIEAVALQSPRPAPPMQSNPLRLLRLGDEVRFTIRVRAIRDGDRWRAASGCAAIAVESSLPSLAAGDRFRAFAHLLPPDRAMNPGEADRAAWDRGRGVTARLRIGYLEAITVLDGAHWLDVRSWLESLRLHGGQVFQRYLWPRQAALASAVLLGLREQLDPDETQAFQLTGTIHLLVIAGLHLGIIAGFAGAVSRRLLPRRFALPAVALFAIAYMLLVDAEPPIVRATVLIVAACFAAQIGRQRISFNVLALAGLIVLLFNPNDLFNVGPQLSFLCVAGLMVVGPKWLGTAPERGPLDVVEPSAEWHWRKNLPRWFPVFFLPDPQPPEIKLLLARQRPWTVRILWVAARFVRHLTLVSGAIWLVTTPLVMARFHIFNPIAIVLNTLVWLPMAFALISGLGVLVCSILPGPLAGLCALLCNGCLATVEWLVRWGARMPYGHAWVPGPADWWLIGFYAAVAVFAAFPRLRPPRRWCFALLGAWTAAGFLAPWLTAERRDLRCTFLNVGHGEAVVLELPSGRTLLYDAGRLGAPSTCCRTISDYLWSRGLTRIDAVVLSHADTDHYNALPELLERFSVGAVYVSPVMFDEKNEAIHYLAESLHRAAVPVRVIVAGDRLSGGPGCRLEVLHPPPRGLPGTSNANSLVLSVEYAGRRVLLPADLQSPGMDDVLAEQPLHCDVLLVPHHGSKSSLPKELAAWSTPVWAVFSADRRYDLREVEAIYAPHGRVLHTADTGAVTARIDENGVRVEEFAAHR